MYTISGYPAAIAQDAVPDSARWKCYIAFEIYRRLGKDHAVDVALRSARVVIWIKDVIESPVYDHLVNLSAVTSRIPPLMVGERHYRNCTGHGQRSPQASIAVSNLPCVQCMSSQSGYSGTSTYRRENPWPRYMRDSYNRQNPGGHDSDSENSDVLVTEPSRHPDCASLWPMLGDASVTGFRAIAPRHALHASSLSTWRQSVGLGRYLETVRNLLSRVPWWLAACLALVPPIALYAIGRLSGSLHGWQQAFSIALGVVFTASAGCLALLDRWRVQQEARLKVELPIDPPDLAIPLYADDDNVIESLVAAEKAACLASLPRNPPRPKRRGGFKGGTVAEELDGGKTGSGYPVETKGGQTLRDYERLLEKKESGVQLTPEEEQSIEGVQKMVSSALSGFRIVNQNAFSRPDERTVEIYLEEVQHYLSRYSEFLEEHLQWEYVKRGLDRLRSYLVNPTDRVFEGVQLEIYLQGDVTALNPKTLSQPSRSKPVRPRPFGTRSPLIRLPDLPDYSVAARKLVIPTPANASPRLEIDNSASAKLTYPPVLLRPNARVPLDDIVIIVNESPGSIIPGTWEASATNTQGRVNGDFTVRVAKTLLPIPELLTEFFAVAGPEVG